MRLQLIFTIAALGFIACAPAEPTNDSDVDVFQTDTDAGRTPLDDPGFDAAKAQLETEEDDLTDKIREEIDDRIVRDARDLEEEGCERVAYNVVRWQDLGHTYQGLIYDLGGKVRARNSGYWAPIDERGGTFAGPWIAPATEAVTKLDGPMGGIFTATHEWYGTLSLGEQPFAVRGKWRRLTREGGIAVGILALCD